MSTSTNTNEKRVSLEYLGHDVLVNGVFPFLSEKDIKALSQVSPLLKAYTEDPAVWHDLYFKAYGTHPNPFTVYNWPEVYRWRSSAGLYTWGSAENGRLGYLISDPKIPDSLKSPQTGWRGGIGICRPYPVESLSGISISDIVSGGYWNAVLSADGKIYGIGELHAHPTLKIPDSESDRREFERLVNDRRYARRHHDPLEGQGDGPFGFRIGGVLRNIFPFRIGGVMNQQEVNEPRLGAPARGNFPFTPHRPRIDNPHPPATTTSADNDDNQLPDISDLITRAPENEEYDTTADIPVSRPFDITDMRDIEREHQRRAEEREKDPDGEIDYTSKCIGDQVAKAKELEPLSDTPINFVSLGGGGRTQLLALDSDHRIWAWDRLFCAPGTKLELKFTDSSFGLANAMADSDKMEIDGDEKSSETPSRRLNDDLKVVKLACGWNCCAALLENIGLTVWYGSDNLQQVPRTKKERREWAKEGRSTEVFPILVPNTDFPAGSPYSIVDFHAGENFIVYVTKEGKLYKVCTDNRDTILNQPRKELTEFYNELEKVIAETPNNNTDKYSDARYAKPKFVRVRGGYKYLAAMTDTDNVICADMNNLQVQAPAELQNAGCISIAAGDHHILALLKGGNLLSWGCECQGCGALGHGQFEDKLSALGARRENFCDYVLPTPKKVETPGKVLVIAAGGWQSAAVITTEDIKDDK